jgi:chondroitin-sulfate-ABC endolyase/exolyase
MALLLAASAARTATTEPAEDGPDFLSFETRLPPTLDVDEQSVVALSSHRRLIGDQSLRWDASSGSVLQFDQSVIVNHGTVGLGGAGSGDFPAESGFVFRIYSEAARAGQMTVEFGRDSGVDCHFQFGLNFTGWRTAWVRFIDMEGTAADTMSFFRFRFPSGVEPGTLYLDGITPSLLIDERLPTSDYQSQVRSSVERLDWEGPLADGGYPPASAAEIEAILELTGQVHAAQMQPRVVTAETVEDLRRRYDEFDIVEEGDHITGAFLPNGFVQKNSLPPGYEHLAAAWREINFRHTGILLRELAFSYHSATAPEHVDAIGQMYLSLSRHLLDQGWTEGSIHGCNFLFGYGSREYYVANFLMRDLLDEGDLLTSVARAMEWYQPARVVPSPDLGINMDYLRTRALGALSTVLMTEDINERVYWTHALSRNVSGTIANVLNTHDAGIKMDGTTFHHWGHYPAYAVGGMAVGAQLLRWLSGTPFRISPEAHQVYASAMLAQRIYMNGSDIPNGIAGRHPFRTRFDLSGAYLTMALAGTPDGVEAIDPRFAAAYLRLAGSAPDSSALARFESARIQAEPIPRGHWSFPYANLSIHRRDDWMVSMKGYGKYVWASEIYSPTNRFGRNQSNGAIEIYNSGGQRASGYQVEGWDWNRIPGTTTLYLPLNDLLPTIDVTMHSSPETTVGSTHLGQEHGVFGMVLNETDFGHVLAARKSAFCFDNRVICLGSAIQSTHAAHPVQTTLYQNSLRERTHPTVFEDTTHPVSAFPHQTQSETPAPGLVLSDPYGNAYFVPGGQQLHTARQEQTSEHSHKDSITHGDFATAWLDHGVTPPNGGYEYAILVQTRPAEAAAFAARMSDVATADYQVLARSARNHIVHDRPTGITGYALFEAGPVEGDTVEGIAAEGGMVETVSAPCFVMTQVRGDHLRISLTDPDLRMQATASPAKLPAEFRLDDPSDQADGTITVRIKGTYEMTQAHPQCRVTDRSADTTQLEFICRYGAPIEISLEER